jgi:hypothetical protein
LAADAVQIGPAAADLEAVTPSLPDKTPNLVLFPACRDGLQRSCRGCSLFWRDGDNLLRAVYHRGTIRVYLLESFFLADV